MRVHPPLDRRGFLAGAALAAASLAAPRLPLARGATASAGQASVAEAYTAMFTTYANNTDPAVSRWTGADSAYSVRLPDGRTVWIFSDTFLGHVEWDAVRGVYTRPQDSPFINNSYVVQAAGAMRLTRTLHGGTAAAPAALVTPAVDDGSWYWLGDATLEGRVLRQLLLRFERTGTGVFDIAQKAVDVATFSLPDLTLRRIDTPAGGNGFTVLASSGLGVSYGSAVLERGAYLYLYGVEDGGFTKWLHLARAPRGGLLGPWEFWDGTRFGDDPQASARLTTDGGAELDSVSNELGVLRRQGSYAAVFQDHSIGNDVLLATAGHRQGPWSTPASVYTCPEHAAYAAAGFANVFPYNAKWHPESVRAGQVLVTYNVNSFDPPDVYADASIYRPRFLRVPLP